jgi:hypothetical protein
LVEICIVKAVINRFRSVNNQEYLLCPAEQLNSLAYTFWLCIYVVNHILTVYILVIVFERYIWSLALASHWLADFCKYHTKITITKLPFPSATDNNSKPINFYHWPRKANPSHLLRQSLFKRWMVYGDSLFGVLCSQRKLAPLSHMYTLLTRWDLYNSILALASVSLLHSSFLSKEAASATRRYTNRRKRNQHALIVCGSEVGTRTPPSPPSHML